MIHYPTKQPQLQNSHNCKTATAKPSLQRMLQEKLQEHGQNSHKNISKTTTRPKHIQWNKILHGRCVLILVHLGHSAPTLLSTTLVGREWVGKLMLQVEYAKQVVDVQQVCAHAIFPPVSQNKTNSVMMLWCYEPMMLFLWPKQELLKNYSKMGNERCEIGGMNEA